MGLRGWSHLTPAEQTRTQVLFGLLCLFSVGVVWGFLSLNALLLTITPPDLWGETVLGMGVLTIALLLIMSRVIERYQTHDFLARLTTVFAGAAIGGLALFWFGDRVLASMGLMILSEVVTLIWVNQWRALLLSGYDIRTARRVLPLTGAAYLFASLVGGLSYLLFINLFHLRAQHIALLWAGVLVITTLILYRLPAWLPDAGHASSNTADDEHLRASVRDSLRYIGTSPYARWVTIMLFIMTTLIALFFLKSSEIATRYFSFVSDPTLLEYYLGQLFAWAEVLGAIAFIPQQVLIFPFILYRFGVGGLNLVHAIVGLILALLMLPILTGDAAPGLLVLVAALLHLYRTLFRRVFRSPVNSLLYHAIPLPLKGRVRSLINGLFAPLGLICAGLIGQLTNTYVLTVLLFVLAGCYLLSCFIVRRRYTEAMLQLVDREDYSSLLVETTETGQVDLEALRLLHQRLKDTTDPQTQQFLIDVLAQTGGASAVPLLLEYAESSAPEQRLSVMQALIQSEALTASARTFFVGYIDSTEPELRRTALIGMLLTADADPPAALRLALDYLHDPDAAIRAQMVRVVLRYGDAQQKDRGRRVLTAMLYDNAFPAHRLEAVRALLAVEDIAFLPLLLDSLWDSDDTVRLTTLRGLNRLWREGIPEAVLPKLRDYEQLLVDDRVEQIREAELLLLRRLNNDLASRVLIQALGDHSPTIRGTAIQALREFDETIEPKLLYAIENAPARIGRFASAVLGLRNKQQYTPIVMDAIDATLSTVHDYYARTFALGQCLGYSTFILLVGYFEEQSRVLLEEVFYLFSILYGEKAFDVLAGLQSQDATVHQQALEALDAMAGAQITKRIAPLYDSNATGVSSVIPVLALNEVLQDLATHGDPWLRAFTVFALGELSAGYAEVRNLLLSHHVSQKAPLNACQKALEPTFISRLLREALSSPEPEIRVAAFAAVRMIQNQDIREALNSEIESTMLATIERMIYLKRVSLFQNFTIEQLRALANICDEQVFKRDAVLFRQNDAGGILFVVVGGRVEVGLRGEDGEFMRLATYGPASAFGEMSLFDHSLRSAEAVAVDDTLTLTIRREPFLALMRRYPDVSVELMSVLSHRLRDANSRLAEFRTAHSRQAPDM